MFQYDSKSNTQPDKTKANTAAANKNSVQAEAQMPVQTKSLFSFSNSLENGEEQKIEQRQFEPAPVKPNNTGIPLQMKEKFESLSGFSFDDVKVHYNSDKPAQLQALAYAQGNQVYIGSGQEKYLGHELGHVVQQKQNRVEALGMLGGTAFNNAPELETEADLIRHQLLNEDSRNDVAPTLRHQGTVNAVAQRILAPFAGNVVGAIVIANGLSRMNDVVLNAEDQVKLNDLVAKLTQFGLSVVPALDFLIVVDNSADSNPANVHLNAAAIIVNMRHWMVRKNNIGFILGMLAHELGAHILADAEMGPVVLANETAANNINHTVVGHTITPVNAANNPRHRQQDHINAAKLTANLAGSSPRAMRYLDTLVRMGNAIVQNAGANPVNMGELRELVETCLFDLGRIIVDDDRNQALRIAWGADQIATVMNWIYQQMSNHGTANPALPTLPVALPGGVDWLTSLNFSTAGTSIRLMLIKRLMGYAAARAKYFFSNHL